jgi:hypothetical protein
MAEKLFRRVTDEFGETEFVPVDQAAESSTSPFPDPYAPRDVSRTAAVAQAQARMANGSTFEEAGGWLIRNLVSRAMSGDRSGVVRSFEYRLVDQDGKAAPTRDEAL